MNVNRAIFREYDIRGIADRDLDSPFVEKLGRAFAAYLESFRAHSVVVGYDARLSSKRLCEAMVRGLVQGGCKVTLLGLCPTPALYFSLYHLKPGAGVMITGSHNPAEFNGFKLAVGKDTIYGKEIQALAQIMEEGKQQLQGGRLSHDEILSDYIDDLKNRFKKVHPTPLKVVLDSGNGTAGLVAPEVIRAIGCEVVDLFSEPDGRFPNHHPDPTLPENLNVLIEAVRATKADLGIAFDGDSDRIGVVDERGEILWADQLMVLFSREILKANPGATFISEVKCSETMYDAIRAAGGRAIMWKTGHSLIKAKMKEVGAAMAGEMSGHLFFADRYFGYDDAIYAACRLVELLKHAKAKTPSVTLSGLLSDLPKRFYTPEIRFDCPDALKFKVVEQVKERFAMQLSPKELITVDGVRVVFKDGWGLLRASNTQPVLVMRFEAKTQKALAAIRSMMELEVRQALFHSPCTLLPCQQVIDN